MSKIERAIERSSLGTHKAKAARRSVPQTSATRIVAASQALKTGREVGWGVAPRSAPTRRRGGSNLA